MYRLFVDLRAGNVEVSAATHLFEDELDVDGPLRPGGDIGGPVDLDEGERRLYLVDREHLIRRLRRDDAVGLVGVALDAGDGDVPAVDLDRADEAALLVEGVRVDAEQVVGVDGVGARRPEEVRRGVGADTGVARKVFGVEQDAGEHQFRLLLAERDGAGAEFKQLADQFRR